MNIQIQHRFSGAALFECELPPEIATQSASRQLGYAIKEALKARAYLAGADLADAYLAGADLADAYLAGANLTRANLTRANLTDAYLAGADLTRANLTRADLTRANLTGANLTRANLTDAYLAGADLTRADLTRANLTRANLTDAYLAGADLTGADLADAYLTDADLTGADLADAYLTGANLTRADLADAYLTGANLTRADLTDAYLADAYLTGADLTGARNVLETNGSESVQGEPTDRKERQRLRAERFRARNPNVPVIPDLDARILGVIESGKGKLRMSAWHTCETTHCRAGWAITLAGEAGKALEEKHGSHRAGAMIYRASTGRTPHFFASDERAMEDIRACAAEQL